MIFRIKRDPDGLFEREGYLAGTDRHHAAPALFLQISHEEEIV